METTDLPAFSALLAQLGTAFQREVTAPVVELYWATLRDCDITALQRAVQRHILTATDRFDFPTVGTLRALATSPALTAARATVIFDHLLASCPARKKWDTGYRGDTAWHPDDVAAEFGLAAREAFLAAGGTSAFRDPDPKSLPFLRRDFQLAFPEALARDAVGLLGDAGTVPQLPGGH